MNAGKSIDTKPNVVFILVDNVGSGNFGVYGGTIPTPRIDKFASEGHPLQQLQRRGAVHAVAFGHPYRAASGSLADPRIPQHQGRRGLQGI